MKKRLIGVFCFLLLVLPVLLRAQEQKQDSVMKFSLEEAKAYALQNSPVMKNAQLDLESAKKKVWETATIGMPQVNGKAQYSYIPVLPALYSQLSGMSSLSSLPFWMYGVDQSLANTPGSNWTARIPAPEGNPPAPAAKIDPNDMKWNAILDVTVSQVIFSGAWIVGLQTSKAFKSLSEMAITKSEKDLKESVMNAYFLVLVSQENKGLLDSTYENTSRILSQIESMNAQGLNEETDVDQLHLTVSTIKNTKDFISNQVESAKNLLRFQMGLSISTPIILTDSLKGLRGILENDAVLLKEFQLESLVDYKLVATQEKLALMNLRYTKTTVLPDIAGFYQHEEYANKKAFVLTPTDLLGVSMNIPIFASGQRYAKIKQAQYGYFKAQNSKFMASEGLRMGYVEAKNAFINSLNKYNTNKDNIKLSEKIYNRTIAKYMQGMASSLELTQAQNQYLQSQSNYFMSIFELIAAQNKLEKFVTY